MTTEIHYWVQTHEVMINATSLADACEMVEQQYLHDGLLSLPPEKINTDGIEELLFCKTDAEKYQDFTKSSIFQEKGHLQNITGYNVRFLSITKMEQTLEDDMPEQTDGYSIVSLCTIEKSPFSNPNYSSLPYIEYTERKNLQKTLEEKIQHRPHGVCPAPNTSPRF